MGVAKDGSKLPGALEQCQGSQGLFPCKRWRECARTAVNVVRGSRLSYLMTDGAVRVLGLSSGT